MTNVMIDKTFNPIEKAKEGGIKLLTRKHELIIIIIIIKRDVEFIILHS